MADTPYAAIAKFLAVWGSRHPSERPLWLVNAVDALGESLNAHATVRAAAARANKNPGPKVTIDETRVIKLSKKKTVAEIVEKTGYSETSVRRILTAAKKSKLG